MADPVGILNGTDCLLAVREANGLINIVAGATTNGTNLSNELLDITSKSSGEFRVLKPSAGTQTVEHTLEAFYSDDAAYQQLLTNYKSRSVDTYLFLYGAIEDGVYIDQFDLAISNMTNTEDLNAPVSSSITLQNSGDFVPYSQYFLAIDSNLEDAIDINSEQVIARA